MAETILFSIPATAPAQDPVYEVLWYQSDNGIYWDSTPVDITTIASLAVEPDGRYRWLSDLADPARFHQIKTRSDTGLESSTGFILPPRPVVDIDLPFASVFNESLTDDGVLYGLGDTVSLMLSIDADAATIIGDTMAVHITDPYDTIIGNVTAQLIGGNLYVAEYIVPKNLSKLYDPLKQENISGDFYQLNDRWLLPNGTILQFVFKVARVAPEIPASPNAEMLLEIQSLKAIDGGELSEATVRFTTRLSPFHCTVQDVIDAYREELITYNAFAIAREILNVSKIVDMHMAPDAIKHKDRYQLAVKNFVKYQVAWNILNSMLNTVQEEKQLETFKISRTTSGDRFLKDIAKHRDKFANIIWAGGNDTIFISKIFEKSLYDPNRPNVARSQLNTTGWYPWVNQTSDPVLINIDGNDVELRGTRYTSFSHQLNQYVKFDKGDLGPFSGV